MSPGPQTLDLDPGRGVAGPEPTPRSGSGLVSRARETESDLCERDRHLRTGSAPVDPATRGGLPADPRRGVRARPLRDAPGWAGSGSESRCVACGSLRGSEATACPWRAETGAGGGRAGERRQDAAALSAHPPHRRIPAFFFARARKNGDVALLSDSWHFIGAVIPYTGRQPEAWPWAIGIAETGLQLRGRNRWQTASP